MIKMIVTDLDETLFTTEKTISDYTLDIFKSAKDSGYKLLFATARGKSTESLVPYELFNGYVLMNGARAYLDGNKIYDRTIEADLIYDFLKLINENNIKLVAEIANSSYANYDASLYWKNVEPLIINNFSFLPGNSDKLYALIEDDKQVDKINEILPDFLYMHVSKDKMGMIMHKEATKKNGILAISNYLNIKKEEILVFGDDTNDIEMLEYFGTGVAMDNALDIVKNVADYTTSTNNDNGVAKWIEKNLL